MTASEEIFDPTKEEIQTFHQKENWLGKISNGGLLVTAKVEEKVVGFVICENREDSLHIWIAGVRDEYRRKGIWKQMYEKIEEYASSKQFKFLTLNSYKALYPGMCKFVESKSFDEYKSKWDDVKNAEKSYFRKAV